MSQPTVVVAVTGSRAEAELIVGMLRNQGLKAAVSADDAGGVDLALQAQGVRVLVAAADAAEAKRLLHEPGDGPGTPNVLQRWLVRLLGGGRSTPDADGQ